MAKKFKKKVPQDSPVEEEFDWQLKDAGIKGYTRNTTFISGRKFRADFWFPFLRLAVEVDGGVWLGGRGGHTSGRGYQSDRLRDQLATMQGITTLRFTSAQIRDGSALAYLLDYIPIRKGEVNGP